LLLDVDYIGRRVEKSVRYFSLLNWSSSLLNKKLKIFVGSSLYFAHIVFLSNIITILRWLLLNIQTESQPVTTFIKVFVSATFVKVCVSATIVYLGVCFYHSRLSRNFFSPPSPISALIFATTVNHNICFRHRRQSRFGFNYLSCTVDEIKSAPAIIFSTDGRTPQKPLVRNLKTNHSHLMGTKDWNTITSTTRWNCCTKMIYCLGY